MLRVILLSLCLSACGDYEAQQRCEEIRCENTADVEMSDEGCLACHLRHDFATASFTCLGCHRLVRKAIL